MFPLFRTIVKFCSTSRLFNYNTKILPMRFKLDRKRHRFVCKETDFSLLWSSLELWLKFQWTLLVSYNFSLLFLAISNFIEVLLSSAIPSPSSVTPRVEWCFLICSVKFLPHKEHHCSSHTLCSSKYSAFSLLYSELDGLNALILSAYTMPSIHGINFVALLWTPSYNFTSSL